MLLHALMKLSSFKHIKMKLLAVEATKLSFHSTKLLPHATNSINTLRYLFRQHWLVAVTRVLDSIHALNRRKDRTGSMVCLLTLALSRFKAWNECIYIRSHWRYYETNRSMKQCKCKSKINHVFESQSSHIIFKMKFFLNVLEFSFTRSYTVFPIQYAIHPLKTSSRIM
jgi:hypothetical protein